MKSISIVIPTYNHYELIHNRLFEIYQRCQPVTEVVVMDNGSTDEDHANGMEWWKTNGMLNVRHFRAEENIGFIRISNIGIKEAIGDIVLLLSNDVQIGTDLVAPMQKHLGLGQRNLVGGRMIDWNSGWNTFGPQVFPYLEGWLLAATRQGWKELGYLDEDLAPYDFEDVALSTRAMMLEYNLIPLNNDKFNHLGGQTIGFNPEREEITNRNREIFRRKYVEQGTVAS